MFLLFHLQEENAKPKGSKLKKLRRKRRKATSKVDPSVSEINPSVSEINPAQMPCPPMTKPSDIYKMFQSKSPDIHYREVLSIEEEDDGPANDVENTDAAGSV